MATDPSQPSKDVPPPKGGQPTDAKTKPEAKTDVVPGKDDLPEREPLTPELVEDEAIRGDFMMRWALVLLALMFGVTDILETETLVHIKSGQYTLQNGLPARTGIFSSTAGERSWANLSWLFDVVLAGFFLLGEAVGLGGGVLLSIFKGLIAATVFGFLVHISRKDLSTWWGTVCAAIALLVCYRQFSAQPEIITLLGITLTLYFLMRWREDDKTKHLKSLAVLFLIWSNLDPGMFYGLAILLFYAVGETAGQWLGFSGLPNDAMRKRLWMTVGACVAVTLLNPFGWNPLLAPYVRYAVEYPALKGIYPNALNFSQMQYYGLAEPRFWERIDSEGVAGLVLLATALVSFGLNFRRLDLGDVLVWLAFGIFALIAMHELAAAAIVSAVLATINAQDWYRATFRQTYSVETSELVFSRGGRAATVLALFGMAYLGVSGRLDRRTGVGIDPHLQGAIDAMREELEDSFDDRPFNFIPAQGDMLIWIDKKAYLDSRIALYHGAGDDDLIALHQRTRSALRKADQAGPAGRKWKEGLDRFEITHVIPRLDSRLSETGSDFETFIHLAGSPDWRLTRFGAATAVFYRTDLPDPRLTAYLSKQSVDFTKLAFQEKSEPPEVRPAWVVGRSTYENLLSRPREIKSNAIELAQHYDDLVNELLIAKVPLNDFVRTTNSEPSAIILALTHAAIRKANEGLAVNPNSATGFRVLGLCYYRLEQLEGQRAGLGGSANTPLGRRRDRQALGALSQAVILDPNDLKSLNAMGHLHLRHGRLDLAAEAWQQCLDILDAEEKPGPNFEETRKRFAAQHKRASDRVKAVQAEMEKNGLNDLEVGEKTRQLRGQFVGFAIQNGLIRPALSLIEDDAEWVASNPQLVVLYIDLLQQSGRFEDASEQLTALNVSQDDYRQNIGLHDVTAFNALVRANFLEAAKTWQNLADTYDQSRLQSTFDAIPFTMRSPESLANNLVRRDRQNRPLPNLWATDQLGSLLQTDRLAGQVAGMLLNVGMTELEAGRIDQAAAKFRRLIDTAPTSPAAGVAAIYVKLITGEDPLPPQAKQPPEKKKSPDKPDAKTPMKTK